MSDYEHLVEVFRITEWRDGCVFKTQSEGECWVDIDDPSPNGFTYTPLTTARAVELYEQGINTIRRKRG